MRYYSLLVFSFLLSCSSPPSGFQAKVVKVKDGDSLEVLDTNNQRLVIRLSHVDCPEHKQPYSAVAKRFTSDFCFGKNVTLEQTDTDRYGRLVCVVLVEGVSLNMALVENGLAWHYTQYSEDADFAEAEQKARENKTGLWQDKHPVPPWEWRRNKKEK